MTHQVSQPLVSLHPYGPVLAGHMGILCPPTCSGVPAGMSSNIPNQERKTPARPSHSGSHKTWMWREEGTFKSGKPPVKSSQAENSPEQAQWPRERATQQFLTAPPVVIQILRLQKPNGPLALIVLGWFVHHFMVKFNMWDSEWKGAGGCRQTTHRKNKISHPMPSPKVWSCSLCIVNRSLATGVLRPRIGPVYGQELCLQNLPRFGSHVKRGVSFLLQKRADMHGRS